MKITSTSTSRKGPPGYALIIVMGTIVAAFIIMSATMNRTTTVQKLNERNNQYNVGLNAAEAACEKCFARIQYDFQSYGYPQFNLNFKNGVYQALVPTGAEDSYWTNFTFLDASGTADKISVIRQADYSGDLPSQYPGLFASASPVYRLISNVKINSSRFPITNAVQMDVLLALVPITTYAIFYNGLLEFSTCADMTVNGRVHSNDKIYTGTDSDLIFNSTVTAVSTLTSPKNNGSGPWTFPGGDFNGSPQMSTGVVAVALSINMTNTHSYIDVPTNTTDAVTYNLANVLLLVSNTTVTVKVQAIPSVGAYPGADPTPVMKSYPTNWAWLATNLPFLSITNQFRDQRENKTVKPVQIDIGKYAAWLKTNASVLAKYPSTDPATATDWPTILYVNDNRTWPSTYMPGVRLTNGISPPVNGGLGFSVSTPDPLYVLGNYNQTNSSFLASTNTSSGTVPCAFMADALTILSSNWRDTNSFTDSDTGPNAATTTVNAAIIAGIVPSTGNTTTTFSGGVHNLPRLLEDWTSDYLWLNTSIVNLYNSSLATNKFVTPGTGSYYKPPTRKFSFDQNFLDASKQPPGVPTALVPIRFNWAVPPPMTTNYNVTP